MQLPPVRKPRSRSKKKTVTRRMEAESVSYVVCQYYGIQTGENSFGYIASWSESKELAELKASLETINKTASGLIMDIDRHFAEVCKERGIDLSAEQEQAQPEQPTPEVAEKAIEPEQAEETYRYYITPEALTHGSYPFMEGGQTHEAAQLTDYEDGAVQAYGYIDYPQPLTETQLSEVALLSSKNNPEVPLTTPEPLTYYAAECMEFPSMGEYHESLTLEEAIRHYEAIPAERMNGIKGIGFTLNDGSDYEGDFPILNGNTIDVDTINSIAYFRDSPLVQKAVADLIAAMPDARVLQPIQDEEALFLVDDANYLHIQTCGEGYDYTIYEKESSHEVDGGVLANPDISLLDACKEIFLIHGMPGETVEPVSLDLLEQLQDAQAVYESEMRPDTPELALDEYPMPDEELTQADLEQIGYLDGDMLPLFREMAQEFLTQDFTVYAITHEGAQMIFDEEDLVSQSADMIFAMSREEWQESSAFRVSWMTGKRTSRNESRRFSTMREIALQFTSSNIPMKQEITVLREWSVCRNTDLQWSVSITI